MVVASDLAKTPEVRILGSESGINCALVKLHENKGLVIYELDVSSDTALYPKPITLQWQIPATDIIGTWKPNSDYAKRIVADWEMEFQESRISIGAPVVCLFGTGDINMHTIACSNAINKLELNTRLREEDHSIYCEITFFTEMEFPLTHFTAQLRLDSRKRHFSEALKGVTQWWETFENLSPIPVPDIAKLPVYSTWYQFHQNLEEAVLIEECTKAVQLGFAVTIIDDGWQTKDSGRGYDYTGDWEPERIPNMASFVNKLHGTGMKVALWYAVPFCGKKSRAYKRFKNKLLTENHRWAPVLDPRFPEVREYLITTYTKALTRWKLDGFKLDFIDDFKTYADTPLNQENGRDYTSINEAVDRLLTDIVRSLQHINPEVIIEFRQRYTGPAMRKYGTMFRAFDCPGDALMNRVRIADIKLLAGSSAVHADMVTWHPDSSLEIAALQFMNTLFGVPQLSVRLQKTSQAHLDMIAFYTRYWKDHAHIFLDGRFFPSKPLANYPLQRVKIENHSIYGVFDAYVIDLKIRDKHIHILNAKTSGGVFLDCSKYLGVYECRALDCRGNLIGIKEVTLAEGPIKLEVPPCGIIIMKQLK